MDQAERRLWVLQLLRDYIGIMEKKMKTIRYFKRGCEYFVKSSFCSHAVSDMRPLAALAQLFLGDNSVPNMQAERLRTLLLAPAAPIVSTIIVVTLETSSWSCQDLFAS